MKLLVFIGGLFICMNSSAQEDRWKISLNGKVLLSTSFENETKNVRRITRTEWNKSGKLEIRYYDAQKNFWIRSFQLNDENDAQLYSADSTFHAKISLSLLRKLFRNKKEIHIYTVATPTDPSIAIRIRRIHLCTLRLP